MRELTTAGEPAYACTADPLCVWAGQGMPDGVRAWAADGAVALASPNICGPVTTAAEPIPEPAESPAWTWMDCSTPLEDPAGAARWLTEDELPAVSELLGRGVPDAYARPGGIGVRRWAGTDDPANAFMGQPPVPGRRRTWRPGCAGASSGCQAEPWGRHA